jgi:hypothetical protein
VKALDHQAKQVAVKSALVEAHKAVIAARHAADEATSLASTDEQKEAAADQEAVATRLEDDYKEQLHRLGLDDEIAENSTDTFSTIIDASNAQRDAQRAQNTALYASAVSPNNPPRTYSGQSHVMEYTPEKPYTSGGKSGQVYTQAEVDQLVQAAKDATTAQDVANFTTQIQEIDGEWNVKMAEAVRKAVQKEKEQAKEVIKAHDETANKRDAIIKQESQLAKTKTQFELEKMRLDNLGKTAESAALTAALDAKAEANTINAQANILAANSKRDAAMAAAYTSGNPLERMSAAMEVVNGAYASMHAWGEKHEIDFNRPPGASYTSGAAAAPGGGPGAVVPTAAAETSEDYEETLKQESAKLESQDIAEGPALEQLSLAVQKHTEALQAQKQADEAHARSESAKLASPDLLATYQAAKAELASSNAQEKTAKTDATTLYRVKVDDAVKKIRDEHDRALALTNQMKVQANAAVKSSAEAVETAKHHAKEVFQKSANKVAMKQQQAAMAKWKEDQRVSTGGASPIQSLLKPEAGNTPFAGGSAADAEAAAEALVETAKSKAVEAAQTAYNLQDITMKARQEDFMQQSQDERAQKAKAEFDVDQKIASTSPSSM